MKNCYKRPDDYDGWEHFDNSDEREERNAEAERELYQRRVLCFSIAVFIVIVALLYLIH